MVRRPELDQDFADIDADHVAGAHEGKCGNRKDQRRGEPEGQRAEPEHGDRREHQVAGPAADRIEAEIERHAERADADRRPQDAELGRTRHQDVAGIDRQQHHGAAEQDGEEIERGRPQYRLLLQHVVEAAHQLVHQPRFLRTRLLAMPDAERGEDRYPYHEQCRSIGEAGRDAVEQPAQGRSRNRPQLPGRGRAADRCRDFLAPHQIGRDGAGGGVHEGAPGRQDREQGQHLPDPGVGLDVGEEDAEDAEEFHQHADDDDAAAGKTVGESAGHHHQQQGRQELHQPDQAEIEGIARDVVDHPAHRDGQDLRRQGAEKGAQLETEEVPVAQYGDHVGLGGQGLLAGNS